MSVSAMFSPVSAEIRRYHSGINFNADKFCSVFLSDFFFQQSSRNIIYIHCNIIHTHVQTHPMIYQKKMTGKKGCVKWLETSQRLQTSNRRSKRNC